MASRVNEVCDALIDRLVSLLPSGDKTTFERTYVPDILDAEFAAGLLGLTGRKVYVMPASYGQAEIATRSQDLNRYGPSVLVVERYTEAGGVARPWLDDRVEWVERQVFGPLQNLRAEPLLGSLWSHAADVTLVFDPDFLREHKLFWSEVTFEFREIK